MSNVSCMHGPLGGVFEIVICPSNKKLPENGRHAVADIEYGRFKKKRGIFNPRCIVGESQLLQKPRYPMELYLR